MISQLNPDKSRGVDIFSNPINVKANINGKQKDYKNFRDMYQQRAKETGLNNIQLQRLERLFNWGAMDVLESDVPAVETSEKDWNPYQALIDYLRFMGELANPDELLEVMYRLLPPKDETQAFAETVYPLENGFTLVAGVKTYEYGYKDAQSGAIVAFEPIVTENMVYHPHLALQMMMITGVCPHVFTLKVLVQLGGEYLRNLSITKMLKLLHYFDKKRFQLLRTDPAVDVPKELGLYEGAKEAEEQDRYTNMRSSSHTTSTKKGKKSGTTYIGSRSSEFFVRIYETLQKHGYDAHRLEAEIKGKKARVVNKMLLDILLTTTDPDTGQEVPRSDQEIARDYQMLLANLITGGFDFYDEKKTKSNGTILEIKVSSFWEKVKEKILAVTPIRIKVERGSKSILKTLSWDNRQCSKTRAKIIIGGMMAGFDYLIASVEEAMSRFNHKDWAEVIVYDDFFNSGFSTS